ncbi:hypothetical protein ACP3V3_01735 [Vibrio sp. PNB22_3_1]
MDCITGTTEQETQQLAKAIIAHFKLHLTWPIEITVAGKHYNHQDVNEAISIINQGD